MSGCCWSSSSLVSALCIFLLLRTRTRQERRWRSRWRLLKPEQPRDEQPSKSSWHTALCVFSRFLPLSVLRIAHHLQCECSYPTSLAVFIPEVTTRWLFLSYFPPNSPLGPKQPRRPLPQPRWIWSLPCPARPSVPRGGGVGWWRRTKPLGWTSDVNECWRASSPNQSPAGRSYDRMPFSPWTKLQHQLGSLPDSVRTHGCVFISFPSSELLWKIGWGREYGAYWVFPIHVNADEGKETERNPL